jgi:hypothetical protein
MQTVRKGGFPATFWNAHHDSGFASMHIYHVASGTPVAAILRPARTLKGTEVRTAVKNRSSTQMSGSTLTVSRRAACFAKSWFAYRSQLSPSSMRRNETWQFLDAIY